MITWKTANWISTFAGALVLTARKSFGSQMYFNSIQQYKAYEHLKDESHAAHFTHMHSLNSETRIVKCDVEANHPPNKSVATVHRTAYVLYIVTYVRLTFGRDHVCPKMPCY